QTRGTVLLSRRPVHVPLQARPVDAAIEGEDVPAGLPGLLHVHVIGLGYILHVPGSLSGRELAVAAQIVREELSANFRIAIEQAGAESHEGVLVIRHYIGEADTPHEVVGAEL